MEFLSYDDIRLLSNQDEKSLIDVEFFQISQRDFDRIFLCVSTILVTVTPQSILAVDHSAKYLQEHLKENCELGEYFFENGVKFRKLYKEFDFRPVKHQIKEKIIQKVTTNFC